eukprot:g1513.t1
MKTYLFCSLFLVHAFGRSSPTTKVVHGIEKYDEFVTSDYLPMDESPNDVIKCTVQHCAVQVATLGKDFKQVAEQISSCVSPCLQSSDKKSCIEKCVTGDAETKSLLSCMESNHCISTDLKPPNLRKILPKPKKGIASINPGQFLKCTIENCPEEIITISKNFKEVAQELSGCVVPCLQSEDKPACVESCVNGNAETKALVSCIVKNQCLSI